MKSHTLPIGQQAGWTQHELRTFRTKVNSISQVSRP